MSSSRHALWVLCVMLLFSLVASLTIPATGECTPVSVSSPRGISRLVVAGGDLSFLIDDLEFWAVPEPNATSILFAGVVLPIPPALNARKRIPD